MLTSQVYKVKGKRVSYLSELPTVTMVQKQCFYLEIPALTVLTKGEECKGLPGISM